jgi:acyl-CoA reductase-like NAD-dependent aldehyde dehydrogenase
MTFVARDPRTGAVLGEYDETSTDEVGAATAAAARAFAATRHRPNRARAEWLTAVADRFDAAGDDLLAVADAETALGTARLTGEWARTRAQVRAFAELVADGSYLDVVVDAPDADSVPPRGDLRRMLVPIGPVANFAASNFPFAFSVPGGDTIAALAAGCPVVVKAHPSHPETSRRCAALIADALAGAGVPDGMFAMVEGASAAVGAALVVAPEIAAVAFTGSRRGGRALYDLAASRPVPIPVYAEMGSVNPVFVTAAALDARGDAIADGLVASMLNGTGQFCTSPGVVVVPTGELGDLFVARVSSAVEAAPPGHLLNATIRDGLTEQLARTERLPGVDVVAQGTAASEGFGVAATVLATDAATFVASPELLEEHFGPVAVVVRAEPGSMPSVARAIPGSLTGTIHAEPGEAGGDAVASLRDALVERVGRLVWNGYPTGVAIAPSMHHGGPYPATTHSGFTSVGQASVRRFLRPVTFQDVAEAALPVELRSSLAS